MILLLLPLFLSDVPKVMLGAAVVRDHARPEWPEGSSVMHAVAAAAAAAAAADAAVHETLPPLAFRQLAEECWAHEPQDRWGGLEACCHKL